MTSSQEVTAEKVVQHNLDCYNNRDINGFMTSFSDDIALYTFPESEPSMVGLEAFKAFYTNLFENSPKLHSTVVNRIIFDNKIIDHETITGRQDSNEMFEIVMIYEVKNTKIFRMTIIRK